MKELKELKENQNLLIRYGRCRYENNDNNVKDIADQDVKLQNEFTRKEILKLIELGIIESFIV
jgi:hypothetical protein